MDEFDMLDLRQEAGWAKWRKELLRRNPPPFLGALVSINEAAEALNRCVGYVRCRIGDGRLNVWKDPVSKRVWILKDDLDILIGDNHALEEMGRSRGGKRRPRKPRNPEPELEGEFEDLDAIGGWEAPKPPPVQSTGAIVAQWKQESEAKYQRAQRGNDEWYAAELAKLEGRDPQEAVRLLQQERGWLSAVRTDSDSDSASGAPTETKTPESGLSLEEMPPRSRSPNRPRKQAPRPVSRSNASRQPPKPVEPNIDPDGQAALPDSRTEVHRPFPTGWVGWNEGAASLQVSPNRFLNLVRKHGLQRRPAPSGPPRFLYDSVEIEALAEKRMAASAPPAPGKRLDWWGSRGVKMGLNPFDSWITVAEAARILGVNTRSISRLCNTGKLPCYQKHPGVSGSRVFVPHHHVLRLKERTASSTGRAAYEKGLLRDPSQTVYVSMEGYGIGDLPTRGWSKACERDHGEYYSTRQAANVLGIGPNAVRTLMRRGRLAGHRINSKRRASRPWWFFKKADVDALLADPQYNRNHKRWLATVRRKAGWED